MLEYLKVDKSSFSLLESSSVSDNELCTPECGRTSLDQRFIYFLLFLLHHSNIIYTNKYKKSEVLRFCLGTKSISSQHTRMYVFFSSLVEKHIIICISHS